MSQRTLDQSGGALFHDEGQDGMLHRAFLRGAGHDGEAVRRSPVIGIANSQSELNPCNGGLDELAEAVKEGIRAAGGLPLEFPTISISEPFTRPTSLYLRNLMSVDVEEMITCSPLDGVVLLGGCDKTIPAQIMGAISAGKPALLVAAGPRPVSCFRERTEFTIDDVWPMCEKRRVGELDDEAWAELEGRVNIGVGTCNVLGTATTMAAVAETLGFALPGSTLAPAASATRVQIARDTGAAIVRAVAEEVTPDRLVTPAALENAFRIVCALGGSTNAAIHLEAIAGRAGFRIGRDLLERWSADTPYIADVRPGGRYLLTELEDAGGVPAIARRLGARFRGEALAAGGTAWSTLLDAAPDTEDRAITPIAAPLAPRGGLIMLSGNLAPAGAILKSAGVHDPRLAQHRGRAVVFEGVADLNSRIDDPDLDVDASSVLVLRGMGVIGAPGMPEVGHIPIPAKLHREGVRDMLRLSDARMSGTSTGTVVLHIAPEAAAGGPLGLLRTGDEIELDAAAGMIRHHIPADELSRREAYVPPERPARGWRRLHHDHILQADEGCDFDVLRAATITPLSADAPADAPASASAAQTPGVTA